MPLRQFPHVFDFKISVREEHIGFHRTQNNPNNYFIIYNRVGNK